MHLLLCWFFQGYILVVSHIPVDWHAIKLCIYLGFLVISSIVDLCGLFV